MVVTGDVKLAGTLTVDLANGFALGNLQKYKIIDNRGTMPIEGNFAGLLSGDTILIGAYNLQISYTGGDGNDAVLTVLQNNYCRNTTLILLEHRF